VFFDQQHKCNILEKCILKGNDELKEEGKKRSIESTKSARKMKTMIPTMLRNKIESLLQSRGAIFVERLVIAMIIAGVWRRMPRSILQTSRWLIQ
jgi:hypothetical protein